MPRRRLVLRLAVLPLVLASTACIEDRLSVDIATQVFPDGSCSRRTEYRLERVDTDQGDGRIAIPPDQDPLRLFHRFPAGEAWRVRDETQGDLHVVVAEASLPSPNEIQWDYWRAPRPKAPPARNDVSFAMDAGGDQTLYDWAETFRDPSSPLEGMRALARGLERREDQFAGAFLARLGGSALSRGEVRRAYRERITLPFSRAVAAIAGRPLYGPRERKELADLWDRMKEMESDFLQALALAAPGEDAERLRAALSATEDEVDDALAKELEAAGLPLPGLGEEPTRSVRFHVTLTLPGPIVRANTCFAGDTATWSFDQQDLYGRGFEMWARAVSQ